MTSADFGFFLHGHKMMFCSSRGQAHFFIMTAYEKLLNRKEWQDRAHQIKTRDNLKCQAFDCTTPSDILQVHHLDYLGHKDPWNYPDDMLITLCKTCHSKEIRRYLLEGRLFVALKQKGFLAGDIMAFTAMLYTDNEFVEELLTQIRNIQNG